ncbi:MAG: hypothetical protein JSW55_19240 [Chloroflexota bacterium]|nr:MAG: hypothetical protein JSW55_19240 [Chloroflexota bacterium]
MSRSLAYMTIEAVIGAMRSALGEGLLSVYLYGSLSDGTYQADQSDINLIAIVDDSANLHVLRDEYRSSIWNARGPVLRRVPLLATIPTLKRHLRLNPLLNAHLRRSGQLFFGRSIGFETGPTVSAQEELAKIAVNAVRASAALAPELLPAKEAQESLALLRSLARRLFGWPVDADESPAVLAGRVLGFARKKMEEESLALWPDQVTPDAPPLVGELRAIYEMDSHLILVMPDLEPVDLARRIASADWSQVADRVADQYRSLRVTTPSQLRLIVAFEDSADYLVQSYHHAWGADPLGDFEISWPFAFRGLARLPSELLLAGLPHSYFTAEDSDLSMLVHDFQNKLLNIQLRSELLSRALDIPSEVPADPLPERDAPEDVRIDGILSHLDWWADHYTGLMQKSAVAEEVD